MTPHRATGSSGGRRTGSTWLRRLDQAVFVDEIPYRHDERRRAGGILVSWTARF